MRITVAGARSLASALTAAAASAESNGATDFDLLDTLQVVDDDTRSQLAAAIAAAEGGPAP